MLKLTDEQYEDALESASSVLCLFDSRQTHDGAMIVARAVMEALTKDFDVTPIDPGPDNDVAEGNVWPRESDAEIAERAFRLPVSYRRGWH